MLTFRSQSVTGFTAFDWPGPSGIQGGGKRMVYGRTWKCRQPEGFAGANKCGGAEHGGVLLRAG